MKGGRRSSQPGMAPSPLSPGVPSLWSLVRIVRAMRRNPRASAAGLLILLFVLVLWLLTRRSKQSNSTAQSPTTIPSLDPIQLPSDFIPIPPFNEGFEQTKHIQEMKLLQTQLSHLSQKLIDSQPKFLDNHNNHHPNPNPPMSYYGPHNPSTILPERYSQLSAALSSVETNQRRASFHSIFAANSWGSNETRSGHGSKYNATVNVRRLVTTLVAMHEVEVRKKALAREAEVLLKVRRPTVGEEGGSKNASGVGNPTTTTTVTTTRVLDAGCGDANWIVHVDGMGTPRVPYLGLEIVPALTRMAREKAKQHILRKKSKASTAATNSLQSLMMKERSMKHLRFRTCDLAASPEGPEGCWRDLRRDPASRDKEVVEREFRERMEHRPPIKLPVVNSKYKGFYEEEQHDPVKLPVPLQKFRNISLEADVEPDLIDYRMRMFAVDGDGEDDGKDDGGGDTDVRGGKQPTKKRTEGKKEHGGAWKEHKADVVVLRDVLSHLPLRDALKTIKHIETHSGAKYLVTNWYHHWDSHVDEDEVWNFKNLDIGGFYRIDIFMPPFNFSHPVMWIQDNGDDGKCVGVFKLPVMGLGKGRKFDIGPEEWGQSSYDIIHL